MDCRRTKEVIPLYVGGDLDAHQIDAVLSHLQACTECSKVAAEYEESQEWLCGFTPPDFPEALFEDLRGSVLAGIEERRSRPTLFQALSGRWNQRLIIAASVALLIVLCVLAVYVSATKKTPSPGPTEANRPQQQQQQPARPNADPQTAGVPTVHEHRRRGTSIAQLRRHRARVKLGRDGGHLARIDRDQKGAAPDGGTETQAPLRIEIQTSDPNIRIIWFSSRSTEPDRPTFVPDAK